MTNKQLFAAVLAAATVGTTLGILSGMWLVEHHVITVFTDTVILFTR